MTRRYRPDADPSWLFYPETILELLHPERPVAVDLRRPLTRAKRQTLRTLGPGPSFAVITAFNPVGVRVSPTENDLRHEQLRADLERSAVPHLRVDGVSPDGCHREEGFAVWLERDASTSLATRFEQSAFFWFDGEAFWVVAALVDAAPLRLPPADG